MCIKLVVESHNDMIQNLAKCSYESGFILKLNTEMICLV